MGQGNKSSSAHELKTRAGLADEVTPPSFCPGKWCHRHPRELPACISLSLTCRAHGLLLLERSPVPGKGMRAERPTSPTSPAHRGVSSASLIKLHLDPGTSGSVRKPSRQQELTTGATVSAHHEHGSLRYPTYCLIQLSQSSMRHNRDPTLHRRKLKHRGVKTSHGHTARR